MTETQTEVTKVHESLAPGAWVENKVHLGRLPASFTPMVTKAKPLFFQWLKVEDQFEGNTTELAKLIAKAYDLFKVQQNGTRVEFARLFDPTIAEDAKIRDLFDNKIFNKLCYLIDKVSKRAPAALPVDGRPPAKEKRENVQADLAAFHEKYDGKKITMRDVDALVTKILEDIWPDKVVAEVLESIAA